MTRLDRLARGLTAAGAVVILLGLGVEVWHAYSHDAAVEALTPFLSLSYEANLPTWYAASLLLACAIVLGLIACDAGAPLRRYWWGLAIMFGYMSLDESAELHERLGGLVGTGGVLYFDWVIPAAIIVGAIGLIYLPFLRRLPAATRRHFVVAGAIYVTGALLMELPLGWWTERAGADNLTYALIDWVEESLEITGATWFLTALIAYRAEARPA
ncbi:MAG TPA: hypothetical protein VML75_00295 [Kofleriaceae bacterium]|nr:hypothetical protein [Kofleriaceae bacterium]